MTDGASELITDVFGDSGTHSRSDVDVEQASFYALVEIETIVATAG